MTPWKSEKAGAITRASLQELLRSQDDVALALHVLRVQRHGLPALRQGLRGRRKARGWLHLELHDAAAAHQLQQQWTARSVHEGACAFALRDPRRDRRVPTRLQLRQGVLDTRGRRAGPQVQDHRAGSAGPGAHHAR